MALYPPNTSERTAAPISAVIATKDRASRLWRTIEGLAAQSVVPDEVIIIDGSKDGTNQVPAWEAVRSRFRRVICEQATQTGAAAQRNQGVRAASLGFVLFCDDDVDYEPECVARLWSAIGSDRKIGGVSAMIVNQNYQPPGTISRALFTLMHGHSEKSFAGKVIGPAINLLPEDRDDLPEVVKVEWVNTTCTMYRRQALPSPPFDSFFSGYSLMEDVTLSLRVAQRGWKLANARTARIYHDSQPGEHKQDLRDVSRMELINRHYVMTRVLERRSLPDYLRLASWEMFQIASTAASAGGWHKLGQMLRGKWRALRQIQKALS